MSQQHIGLNDQQVAESKARYGDNRLSEDQRGDLLGQADRQFRRSDDQDLVRRLIDQRCICFYGTNRVV